MFPDILELINYAEDTQQSDQYLYRGQLERGRHHEWKVNDKLYQVESMYPSDFRFHYEHHEPSEEVSRKISAARAFNRERRDQFAEFLLVILNDIRTENGWADAELNNLSGRTDQTSTRYPFLQNGVVISSTLFTHNSARRLHLQHKGSCLVCNKSLESQRP